MFRSEIHQIFSGGKIREIFIRSEEGLEYNTGNYDFDLNVYRFPKSMVKI